MVTSLWKVDDYASSVIMQYYYEALAKGMRKDAALQQAKLTYLGSRDDERSEHPYYWAPLIHIGNDTPVPQNRSMPWYFFAGGMILIGLWIGRKRLFQRKAVPDAA
jgi:hypothetical protein